jgi:hypothetical protein
MSSTLHLPIKQHWFDEIAAERKPFEYRRVTKHWVSRMCTKHAGAIGGDLMDKHKVIAHNIKQFDTVTFTAGYNPDSPRMVVEVLAITIGLGDASLGAPENEDVFIISLGKILQTYRYEKAN